jgi:hypothetical protein
MERIKNFSLQISDEIDLHRKGWVAQRIGWAVLLLLVTAALIGVFGTGWISSRHIILDGNKVSFERFARFEAPMKLIVHAAKPDGAVEIRIPQTYLANIEIDKIVPAPSAQKISQEAVIYTFNANASMTVIFYLIAESTGTVDTKMAVNNSVFPIRHFIYP